VGGVALATSRIIRYGHGWAAPPLPYVARLYVRRHQCTLTMPSPVTGITASDSSYAFEGINIPDRLHAPCSADDGTNDTVRTDQHVDLSSSIDKKPILKKRSISERILEESYVGAATPYQGKDGRSRITRPASGCLVSRGNSGTISSTTYGVSYRSWKRKCVHFNEQVDHFIVIQVKGDRCSHILPASTRSGNCRG
jgi:hypothetical protein